jgi:hypothetical protein
VVSLLTQKDFRPVQRLPFCYLCARLFGEGEKPTRDHVPNESVFAVEHKEPLLLPTHLACNARHSAADEQMGQLIALLRGYVPSNPAHQRLVIEPIAGGFLALRSVNVHAAVWRWVRGFHAALYRQPLRTPFLGELTTPFPSAEIKPEGAVLEIPTANYPQLAYIVEKNRAASNTDRIVSNAGVLKYECVWGRPTADGPWLCAFTLDIYDWKDLGEPRLHQRDCLGFYVQDELPSGATIEVGKAS